MHLLKFLKLIVITVYLFGFGQASADPSHIQAAASLLHHMGTLIGERIDQQNTLILDEQDVRQLWENLKTVSGDVESSFEAYYSRQDYAEANRLLGKIWKRWVTEELATLPSLVQQATTIPYNQVDQNPYLSDEVYREISPYLLPYGHPVRPTMDAIFNASRVTFNKETLKGAGFTILFSQPRSFIKVVQHPALSNLLIKLYLDVDLRMKQNKPGWSWLVKRCQGAEKIRKILKKYQVLHFEVPHKWIYPLSPEPAPPLGLEIQRQLVVLLVDDMHLVSKEENLVAWKNFITKKHLDELYLIISLGNGSSYRADNIPFSKSGKFAFIDTEYPHRPPNFSGVRPYLSTRMRLYWDNLVKKGGKKIN